MGDVSAVRQGQAAGRARLAFAHACQKSDRSRNRPHCHPRFRQPAENQSRRFDEKNTRMQPVLTEKKANTAIANIRKEP